MVGTGGAGALAGSSGCSFMRVVLWSLESITWKVLVVIVSPFSWGNVLAFWSSSIDRASWVMLNRWRNSDLVVLMYKGNLGGSGFSFGGTFSGLVGFGGFGGWW